MFLDAYWMELVNSNIYCTYVFKMIFYPLCIFKQTDGLNFFYFLYDLLLYRMWIASDSLTVHSIDISIQKFVEYCNAKIIICHLKCKSTFIYKFSVLDLHMFCFLLHWHVFGEHSNDLLKLPKLSFMNYSLFCNLTRLKHRFNWFGLNSHQ